MSLRPSVGSAAASCPMPAAPSAPGGGHCRQCLGWIVRLDDATRSRIIRVRELDELLLPAERSNPGRHSVPYKLQRLCTGSRGGPCVPFRVQRCPPDINCTCPYAPLLQLSIELLQHACSKAAATCMLQSCRNTHACSLSLSAARCRAARSCTASLITFRACHAGHGRAQALWEEWLLCTMWK